MVLGAACIGQGHVAAFWPFCCAPQLLGLTEQYAVTCAGFSRQCPCISQLRGQANALCAAQLCLCHLYTQCLHVQVVSDTPKSTSFRAFLDECQYSTRSILRYEQIFGPGYVSTGGFETTKVLHLRACWAAALQSSVVTICGWF